MCTHESQTFVGLDHKNEGKQKAKQLQRENCIPFFVVIMQASQSQFTNCLSSSSSSSFFVKDKLFYQSCKENDYVLSVRRVEYLEGTKYLDGQ